MNEPRMEVLLVKPKIINKSKDMTTYQGAALTLSYYDKKRMTNYSILEDGKEYEGVLAAKNVQYTEKEITFRERLEYRITFDANDPKSPQTIEAMAILNHPFVWNVNKDIKGQSHNFGSKTHCFFEAEIISESSKKVFTSVTDTFKVLLEFFKLPKEEYLDVAYAMNISPVGLNPQTLIAKLADTQTGAIIKNNLDFQKYLKDRVDNKSRLMVNKAAVLGLLGNAKANGTYVFDTIPVGRTIDEVVAYFNDNAVRYEMLKSDVEAKNNALVTYHEELKNVDTGIALEGKSEKVDLTPYKDAIQKLEDEKNAANEDLKSKDAQIAELTNKLKEAEKKSSKITVAK